MGVHAYHDELPGYDPEQIWHDGCPECEERGLVVYRGIGQLDHSNYARAKQRAIDWNMTDTVGNVSQCERVLLETLWAIRCQEETARSLAAYFGGGAE